MIWVLGIALVIVLGVIIWRNAKEKYGDTLMRDPAFIKLAAGAEKDFTDAKEKVVEAMDDVINTDSFQNLQNAVNEMQDVKKGIALHLLRLNIRKQFDVDWDTAIQCVNTGLKSGKMTLDTDNVEKNFPTMVSLLEVQK